MAKSTTKPNNKQSDKEKDILPPLLYPAKTTKEKAWMKSLKDDGRIRSIGARLYTSVTPEQTETTVRGCWTDIVSELYPDAILSYRSALEFNPDETNTIYLTGTTNRRIEFPGLTLEFIRGPGPLEDDPPFRGFHTSSFARALLENLSVTKKAAHRGVSQEAIEIRLETELRIKSEEGVNEVRDRAREIAEQFDWQRAFKKLDELTGGILGTRPIKKLKTQVARARAKGNPFDPVCNAKLEVLHAELRANPLPDLKDNFKVGDHFRNKAFFEAYFSNYIEGTKFEIEEAEEIVFESIIPEKRPRDAHDILGTYQIVSNPTEARKCPKTLDEFNQLICSRHITMMKERPEISPGEFKDRPNKAGNTHFVAPEFIEGTFEKGFQKYLELPVGLSRAIYIMFLVAEVHPFNDGNGRISRIMMNAELQAQGLVSIIIPTVFREDYLGGLRALSRRERPTPLVRMLTRAQIFSNLAFSPYREILKAIEEKNWFFEPSEAKIVEG